MRKMFILGLASVLSFTIGQSFAGSHDAESMTYSQQETLYQKLGGYDAVSAVAKDLATRLVKDPQLGVYFKGLNTQDKLRLINRLTDFLCNATGGPCIYTGRDMRTAHEGLGITDNDWDRFVYLAQETFNKYNIPSDLQNQLLQALGSLKPAIVQGN